jgi:hypothetical protein
MFRALFLRWTWRMAWRESRSSRSRLLWFSLSISLGVGALAAVGQADPPGPRLTGCHLPKEKTMADVVMFAQTAADTARETMQASRQALVDSFTQAWTQVILLAPKMVAMVAVLVIGYVLARWFGGLIAVVTEKIGLQTAAEKSGLAKSMHDVGIRRAVRQPVLLLLGVLSARWAAGQGLDSKRLAESLRADW